jgi:hypothetical protein
MDGPDDQIMKAMNAHLRDASIVPDINIAFPNAKVTSFTKPSVGDPASKWLRVTFLPAETQAFGISDEADNQNYGFMQVDVFTPLEVGELHPVRIANEIMAAFRKGTVMFEGGYKTRIYAAPTRLPMVKEDEWVMVPVRVPYKCFAPTPTLT